MSEKVQQEFPAYCAPGWQTPSMHWSSRITGPQKIH